jgi:hypothetical protein
VSVLARCRYSLTCRNIPLPVEIHGLAQPGEGFLRQWANSLWTMVGLSFRSLAASSTAVGFLLVTSCERYVKYRPYQPVVKVGFQMVQ